MKNITLLIITALCSMASFGQGRERYVDSLINWLKEHPTIDSQYILTLHRISYRTSEKNIATSFRYYEKVSELSDKLHFTYGKSLSQINLGILLYSSGNYDASNNAYFRAIAFAEECDNDRLKAVSFNNIGENFRSLKNYAKCKEYCHMAIELNKKANASRGVAINYELIQKCYLAEGRFLDAKTSLVLGMPYALESGDSYVLSTFYLGFGKYHAHFNRLDSANYYFSRAYRQAIEQNDLRNLYQLYLAKVTYLPHLAEDVKLRLLDSAYRIAVMTRYMEGIGNAAELLSDYYDGMDNKDSSAHYFHIYRSTYDSIFSENNRRNTVIKETDWMLKRKEIENLHLQELAAIQEKELIFKNALLIAVGGLLTLLVVTSVVIYRSGRASRKRAESEFEKKILDVRMHSLQSQMNPHFIFNSLNSIENFIMQNEKRAASDYLNKFSSLVRTILESNRMELIPFEKDFEAIKLYIQLEQLRFNNKFSFQQDVERKLFNPEYRVPPLLIQPYVENAIIHGLSQSDREDLYLKISASVVNDYIVYIIEDNGIGRMKASRYRYENKPYHNSMGLQLTKEKIDIFNLQHHARNSVKIMDLYDDDAQPAGTKVMVKVKIV